MLVRPLGARLEKHFSTGCRSPLRYADELDRQRTLKDRLLYVTHPLKARCAFAVLTTTLTANALTAQRIPELKTEDVPRIIEIVKPQPDESTWRDIPWQTDLRTAREQAAQEGKPLLIFTAADGSPLGRT